MVRRGHLALVVVVVLLAGFLVFELGVPAPALAKKDLKLRVVVELGTFDASPGPGMGQAFYVEGTICDKVSGAACEPAGVFRCWGWQTLSGAPGNVSVVSQEFEIFGRGKLQVQGVEDNGPRAVTGGTGDFRNVRGEGEFDITGFPVFTVSFKLQGAKK